MIIIFCIFKNYFLYFKDAPPLPIIRNKAMYISDSIWMHLPEMEKWLVVALLHTIWGSYSKVET